MSVDMFFELDADLTLRRLIFDKRMFQKLFGAGPHCIIFYQTHLDKVVKLLRPSTTQYNNHSLALLTAICTHEMLLICTTYYREVKSDNYSYTGNNNQEKDITMPL